MSCFEVLLKLKYLFGNYPKIKYQLAILYKKKYFNTIFYDTCSSTLRFITNDRLVNPNKNDEQNQEFNSDNDDTIIRRSTTQISHYQDERIFIKKKQNTNKEDLYDGSIPASIKGLNYKEKQFLLKTLIEKSYLFVDLSDLLEGEDLDTYEAIVKEEIFVGEQSILQTGINKPKQQLTKRLKYFDCQAIHLLKNYVDYSQIIVNRLEQANDKQVQPQFFKRLLLQLKATLLQRFPQSDLNSFSSVNSFLKQYKMLISIYVSTIEMIDHVRFTDAQYADNFFTRTNIQTLISVIIFQDQGFLKAVFQRFISSLKLELTQMVNGLNLDDDQFYHFLKSSYFNRQTKTKKIQIAPYESNLQKLLKRGNSKQKYFKRSLRTLDMLINPKQPIKVLKIIYQLNKTISRQHTQFINSITNEIEQKKSQRISMFTPNSINNRFSTTTLSKGQQFQTSQDDDLQFSFAENMTRSKNYSFSREVQCTIIQWLITHKKEKAKFIIVNCLMTYLFINENQLKDKKGSALIPFIQIVQKYISK